MKPVTLIDSALYPDVLADQEMGMPGALPGWDGNLPEGITNQEIHDCRMQLVLREAMPLPLGESTGGTIELGCTFQPAAGLRFISARLTITLDQPEGVRIIDVAPQASHSEPVWITLDRSGQLGLSLHGAELGAGAHKHISYQHYHCEIRGSGADIYPARWDFSEDPNKRDGLANDHALFLTLANSGTIRGRVTLSGEVERPGLMGVRDRVVRWLRLGTTPEAPYVPLKFEIPSGS